MSLREGIVADGAREGKRKVENRVEVKENVKSQNSNLSEITGFSGSPQGNAEGLESGQCPLFGRREGTVLADFLGEPGQIAVHERRIFG